jgi:uncharacterized membrane protein YbhN (UPF0104 family)
MRPMRTALSEIHKVARAATTTHRRLRDRLAVIALATFGVDLVCAVLAFLLERNADQTGIKTFGSALFWTSTQLLTVSSQLKNPITPAGRVLDVFMEAYAITVIAALAASMGAFVHKRSLEIDAEVDGSASEAR